MVVVVVVVLLLLLPVVVVAVGIVAVVVVVVVVVVVIVVGCCCCCCCCCWRCCCCCCCRCRRPYKECLQKERRYYIYTKKIALNIADFPQLIILFGRWHENELVNVTEKRIQFETVVLYVVCITWDGVVPL